MREPCPSLPRPPDRLTGVALAFVPAAIVTAIMAVVLLAAPALGAASKLALYEAAVLANLAVWFAFAPVYLGGWVHFWDPAIRGRTGVLGVAAVAGVLWFANLFAYAVTGSALGALLRS